MAFCKILKENKGVSVCQSKEEEEEEEEERKSIYFII